MTVEVHGFAGNAGEYNERIRREYESPFKPGDKPDRVLPPLITGQASGGRLAPYITTAEAVPHDRLNSLLGTMSQALDEADGSRGYRLDEDIEIYGQQETTLHVALLRQISEPDGEGGHRVRQVVDLTAVKGANRTRARLKLFGLTAENIVFGVRPRVILGVASKEAASADSRAWVPVLANLLRSLTTTPRTRGTSSAAGAAGCRCPAADHHRLGGSPRLPQHRLRPEPGGPPEAAARLQHGREGGFGSAGRAA